VREPTDTARNRKQHEGRIGRQAKAAVMAASAKSMLGRSPLSWPAATRSSSYSGEAFTCVFAAGRAGGWIAHAREQMLRAA